MRHQYTSTSVNGLRFQSILFLYFVFDHEIEEQHFQINLYLL